MLSSVGATIVAAGSEQSGSHDDGRALAGLADISAARPRSRRERGGERARGRTDAPPVGRRRHTRADRRARAEGGSKPSSRTRSAHLAHRDAAVMTAVAGPRLLGEVLVGGVHRGRRVDLDVRLAAWAAPAGNRDRAHADRLALPGVRGRSRRGAADRGSGAADERTAQARRGRDRDPARRPARR